jgi:hypothetical protein
MAQWIVEGRQSDLIYIDGSHTLGDTMCDLRLADGVTTRDCSGVAAGGARLTEQ